MLVRIDAVADCLMFCKTCCVSSWPLYAESMLPLLLLLLLLLRRVNAEASVVRDVDIEKFQYWFKKYFIAICQLVLVLLVAADV